MSDKVAGTIAAFMAGFFLIATLIVADGGKAPGAAAVGAFFFAVLTAVSIFSFALSTDPKRQGAR